MRRPFRGAVHDPPPQPPVRPEVARIRSLRLGDESRPGRQLDCHAPRRRLGGQGHAKLGRPDRQREQRKNKRRQPHTVWFAWIPACAGMTGRVADPRAPPSPPRKRGSRRSEKWSFSGRVGINRGSPAVGRCPPAPLLPPEAAGRSAAARAPPPAGHPVRREPARQRWRRSAPPSARSPSASPPPW